MQAQDNTEVPSIKVINNKSDNKSTKKLTKELINESDNESTKQSTKQSTTQSTKQSTNKPNNKSINKEVNSNTTSWYDTDKFNEILAAIDNNNFNHKNKVGKLKFNDINDLINSIKNSTISEADAKNKIN